MNDNLSAMNEALDELRRATERLMALAEQPAVPAVLKNGERILACVEMLELHVRDVVDVLGEEA